MKQNQENGESIRIPGFIRMHRWTSENVIYIRAENIEGFQDYKIYLRLSRDLVPVTIEVLENIEQIAEAIRTAQWEAGYIPGVLYAENASRDPVSGGEEIESD